MESPPLAAPARSPFDALRSFLIRSDPAYDRRVAESAARTTAERWKVVLLHLAPGFLGFLSVKLIVPAAHTATNLSYAWLQFLTLGSMAIFWELTLPFVWLRREGKTFRESLDYLGLTVLDPKGVLIIAPLSVLLCGWLAFPYLAHWYDPVREWLDRWSVIHMPEWHILYFGYYNFPGIALLLVLIGNFLGEEVYFRGFLLKRLGFLGAGAGLVSNGLFCAYHLWQAPVNWAYLPVFFLLPFGYLMQWRKSLWVTVMVHVLINFDLLDRFVAVLKG
jgi:membrane protease YdiL (CAAX protease family)